MRRNNRSPKLLLGAALGLLLLTWAAGAEPWPYQPFNATHPVGNNFGEYQNYGGSPYYHDGIDLVTPWGQTQVFSVAHGTVTHITYNQPIYSGIMIGDPVSGGTGWLYWHIDANTFQYDIGDVVAENAYIGTTAVWPVANFNHVHFNRVRGTGGYPWSWYEAIDNPLLYMVPNTDIYPPEFEITYNGQTFAFAAQSGGTVLDPMALSGQVDIISRVKDNQGFPQWAGQPWKVDYWIEGAVNSVPLTNSVTFSGHIPPDNTVSVIYRTTYPMATQGDYDNRIYYFIVTNTDGDGFVELTDANYYWDTGAVAAGDYWVYVQAEDIGGTVVTDSMLCRVAGATSPDIALPETAHDFGPVLPGDAATWDLVVQNTGTDPLSVRSVSVDDPVFAAARSHFFVLPGEEELVAISFMPEAMGPYAGTLEIESDDPDEPLLTVALSGTGADYAAVEERAAAAPPLQIATLARGGLSVSFALAAASPARVEIFDVSGRRVRSADLGSLAAGTHDWVWDGAGETGAPLPSAVYLVRLSAGEQSFARTGLLLR
jgi:hypothetical protein